MVVDVNLLVGRCPFRAVPAAPADLVALRSAAGLERAVASGFRSLFYYDPIAGLEEDLTEFAALADWLYFYAVVHPEFPQAVALVDRAAADPRLVGVRLVPALHHYTLCAPTVGAVVARAGERGLAVNLMARLFDDRIAPRCVAQAVPDLDAVAAFVEQSDDTRLILSMFYFSELKALNLDWARLPQVYVDFGCCKPSVVSLDELAAWFPLERALFGSGAPLYYWQGSRLGLEGARLDAAVRRGILGNNAREVFGW